MENGHDNVSNIHRRWSLTRINFSSYKISLSLSLLGSLIIIIFFDQFYLRLNLLNLFFVIITGISFLVFSYFFRPFSVKKNAC